MMSEINIAAPAKLNWYLRVLRIRADAYHEIQTAFQFLDLSDSLCLSLRSKPTIDLTISADSGEDAHLVGIPTDESNSVVRAALLLQAHCGVRSGVHINLCKRIPAGAGLGGGSSDAASVLVGLNQLWGCGLSSKQLAVIGRYLGADVPVFVYGYAAQASGAGDLLSPRKFPECYYLLLVPTEVATAKVFSSMGINYCRNYQDPEALLQDPENCCLPFTCTHYPEVGKALAWLNQYGVAQLTGTGGGVFLRFKNMSTIKSVLANVPNTGWRAFVVRGLNTSPTLLVRH